MKITYLLLILMTFEISITNRPEGTFQVSLLTLMFFTCSECSCMSSCPLIYYLSSCPSVLLSVRLSACTNEHLSRSQLSFILALLPSLHLSLQLPVPQSVYLFLSGCGATAVCLTLLLNLEANTLMTSLPLSSVDGI